MNHYIFIYVTLYTTLLLYKCIINIYYYIAPSGPPTVFNVTSNSSNPQQLVLEWEPPSLEDRNGIIIRYNYNCTDDDDSTNVQSGYTMNTLTASVDGFRVFANHTCYVTALTNEGEGPAAVYNDARTAEDGKHICLFTSCSALFVCLCDNYSICLYMYIYIHMYIYIYTYMYIYIHTCTCTYIYIYIHVHVYIYVHFLF